VYRWLLAVVAVMTATAIAGELKFSPFFGAFRISLGSAVFYFMLLLFRPKYLPVVGVLVGAFVSLFRMTLDWGMGVTETWAQSYTAHMPSAWYYIAFALLLQFVRYPRFLSSPLMLGLLGGAIDFTSNLVELAARMLLEGREIDPIANSSLLFLLGLLRSFFVVGIYNIFEIRQLRAVSREQQKRMETLLLILSELHEERLYLQKMMKHVEQITAGSYKLYRSLAGDGRAREALRLAEEVHEVKKDAQRIVAGLSKLIKQERVTKRMTLQDVAQLVAKANTKYAEHLGKSVDIEFRVQGNRVTNRFYSLLSVMNNIVANAIEAIRDEGRITIDIFPRGEDIWIEISDDGPGIGQADRELIFQPGYTTKYDHAGNASTGIGLTYVKSTLDELAGSVEVTESRWGGALFRIVIPISSLTAGIGKVTEVTGP
jgi:two-component system sensor histidine kinase YcbA